SRAEEARHRSRYAGWDDPTGRQLADEFRREIPNRCGDPTTTEAEPARDPVDHGAAECSLDLWPRERCPISLAEPSSDLGTETSRLELLDESTDPARRTGH